MLSEVGPLKETPAFDGSSPAKAVHRTIRQALDDTPTGDAAKALITDYVWDQTKSFPFRAVPAPAEG